MKASTIYRRAAEEVLLNNYFYGKALDIAHQPDPGGPDSPLQDYFLLRFEGIHWYWWHAGEDGEDSIEEAQATQCLALCLMADIVASEGR